MRFKWMCYFRAYFVQLERLSSFIQNKLIKHALAHSFELHIGVNFYSTSGGIWRVLMHKLWEFSHLSSLIKWLWPLKQSAWTGLYCGADGGQCISKGNLHCLDTDFFARLSANIVSLFWCSVGLAVTELAQVVLESAYFVCLEMPTLLRKHN